MTRNELVTEALPDVRSIVWAYCGRRGIASLFDVVLSDAYEGLVRLAETYKPDRGVPWLHYVRYNLERRIVDALRKHGGRPHQVGYDARHAIRMAGELPDYDRPELGREDPNLAEVEVMEIFSQTMASLPERSREMVALRIQGESMTAVADRFGVSESRVSQLLTEIRLVLERELV